MLQDFGWGFSHNTVHWTTLYCWVKDGVPSLVATTPNSAAKSGSILGENGIPQASFCNLHSLFETRPNGTQYPSTPSASSCLLHPHFRVPSFVRLSSWFLVFPASPLRRMLPEPIFFRGNAGPSSLFVIDGRRCRVSCWVSCLSKMGLYRSERIFLKFSRVQDRRELSHFGGHEHLLPLVADHPLEC